MIHIKINDLFKMENSQPPLKQSVSLGRSGALDEKIVHIIQNCTYSEEDWNRVVKDQNGDIYLFDDTDYIILKIVRDTITIRNSNNKYAEIITYHPNNTVKKRESYYNLGEGNLAFIVNRDTNGFRTGKYMKFYPNKIMKKCGTYKDGFSHGEFRWFWDNGNLKEETFYQDGKAEGECVTYYENGSIESIGHYKNGNLEGQLTVFYPSEDSEKGIHQKVCFYKNGELDGPVHKWYENGNYRKLYQTSMGMKNGPCKEYNEDGTIHSKCTYEYNLLHGKYYFYHDGNEDEMETYSYGILNGQYCNWWPGTINLKVRGQYNDDKPDGVWEYFDEDENLIMEEIWDNDRHVLEKKYGDKEVLNRISKRTGKRTWTISMNDIQDDIPMIVETLENEIRKRRKIEPEEDSGDSIEYV